MATVTFKNDITCTLIGNEINVGDMAPSVKVVNSNPMLQDETVGGASDKTQLLIVVPSLDTPVCDSEARKFNAELASNKDINVKIISMDLPFAAARFCSAAGIENLEVCSDYKHKDFANAYGVLLATGPLTGLTCRAIFVISKEGKVCYKEIVPEITDEPDYEAALAAANASVEGTCCADGSCS